MKFKCLLFIFFILLSCGRKIVIPFNYSEYDRTIYIDTKINNDTSIGKFVYDTGSPLLCIDSIFFYSKTNIKKSHIEEIGGVGTESFKAIQTIDTIGFKLSKFKFLSNNINVFNLNKFSVEKDDGILGVQTFQNIVHKIDYQKKKIILNPSLNGYKWLDIKFERNRIYIPMTIILNNGISFKGNYILDTGAGNSKLNSTLYQENLFSKVDKVKYYSESGIGGKSSGFVVRADKIFFGDNEIDNHILGISLDSRGALSSNNFLGIIGNDILSKFTLIYDLPNNRIGYKQIDKISVDKPLFIGFRVFNRIENNQGWIVKSLQEGSDAFKKGLIINDRIVAINGIQVGKINMELFFEELEQNDKLLLDVVKQDNKNLKLEIILKPFFNEK